MASAQLALSRPSYFLVLGFLGSGVYGLSVCVCVVVAGGGLRRCTQLEFPKYDEILNIILIAMMLGWALEFRVLKGCKSWSVLYMRLLRSIFGLSWILDEHPARCAADMQGPGLLGPGHLTTLNPEPLNPILYSLRL